MVNGTDWASVNIQRSRDHGLGSYNDAREALGLSRKDNFSDISSDPEVVALLESVYDSVDDIDLWVGMLSEDHLPDSSLGELNKAILADQFTRLRDGDRFWYENDSDFGDWELGDESVSEWLDDLQLSDIINVNTGINNISDNVFFVPSSVQVPDNSASPVSLIILASFWIIFSTSNIWGRLWKRLSTFRIPHT